MLFLMIDSGYVTSLFLLQFPNCYCLLDHLVEDFDFFIKNYSYPRQECLCHWHSSPFIICTLALEGEAVTLFSCSIYIWDVVCNFYRIRAYLVISVHIYSQRIVQRILAFLISSLYEIWNVLLLLSLQDMSDFVGRCSSISLDIQRYMYIYFKEGLLY